MSLMSGALYVTSGESTGSLPPGPCPQAASAVDARRVTNSARIVISEDATIIFGLVWHPHGVLLRVTKGAIRDGTIRDAVVRAELPDTPGDRAALAFTYVGVVAPPVALASGEVRHQLGVKLRAQNTCNVLYVMWLLGGEIAVSIKHNPGMATHAECGARGYAAIAPAWSSSPPVLAVGARHVLSAAIAGDELSCAIDGASVWRGALPTGARMLHGPIGLRTDNVALDRVALD
jgi:hypothetical protein